MSVILEKRRDRLALRASTTYLLQCVDLMARVVGGDILRGVIFTAVVDANVRHLRPGDAAAQAYSETADRVPDDLRKPISVHALALALAVPYETTRRHVNALIAEGLCERAEGGIIVPAQVLAKEPLALALRRNFDNLQQLVGDLREGGVDFACGEPARA
ncbi:MAG: hypothetical protein Q8L66_10225 [Caulobacter sp.]|nr:hypothetical protein [Caulobacter sp.]